MAINDYDVSGFLEWRLEATEAELDRLEAGNATYSTTHLLDRVKWLKKAREVLRSEVAGVALDRSAAGGHEYHRGYLPFDCADSVIDSDALTQSEVATRKLRREFLAAAERGDTHLYQHRHGPFDYSYFSKPVGPRNPRRHHR